MTEEQLKPCPFCGGEVEMHYEGSSDWVINCKSCPVQTQFWISGLKYGFGEGETAQAIKRWNTRPTLNVRKAAEQIRADEKPIRGAFDTDATYTSRLQEWQNKIDEDMEIITNALDMGVDIEKLYELTQDMEDWCVRVADPTNELMQTHHATNFVKSCAKKIRKQLQGTES